MHVAHVEHTRRAGPVRDMSQHPAGASLATLTAQLHPAETTCNTLVAGRLVLENTVQGQKETVARLQSCACVCSSWAAAAAAATT